MTNKAKFAELMQFLAIGIKGQELTKVELQAYWYALEDEFNNIEEFEIAVKKLLKSWKYSYFPKPSHFLEANKEYTEPEVEKIALDAWKTVLNAIENGVGYSKIGDFEDKLIPPVVELCGGFKRLATKTFEELEWIKKEFLKTYKAAINGEIELEVKEVLPILQEAKTIKIKANYHVLSRKIIETSAIENKTNTLVKKLKNAKRM